MRCVIQRVSQAKVEIEGKIAGEIGPGLMILVCAMRGDESSNAEQLARKVAALRIFADDTGKMNKSIKDVGGSALVVSQFTLSADTSRGNRPGFSMAADPEIGKKLYEEFCEHLRGHAMNVATGEFGADMAVTLTNDGPVTIWLDL